MIGKKKLWLIGFLVILLATGAFAAGEYKGVGNAKESAGQLEKAGHIEDVGYIEDEEHIDEKLQQVGDGYIEPVRVPILMYHHFVEGEKPFNSSTISVGKAESDIKKLKAKGYSFISLVELSEYLEGKRESLPENPIVITVDDGYESVDTYLYPLAKKYDMKFTLGVLGYMAGKDKLNGQDILPHLPWEKIREMQSSGLVEIQNHTYDLHTTEGVNMQGDKKTGLGVKPYSFERKVNYIKRLKEDVMKLEDEMEKRLGKGSEFIVYPYGAYESWTEEAMKDYFKGSLTVRPGVREYGSKDDLWEMPRLNVDEDTDVISEIESY